MMLRRHDDQAAIVRMILVGSRTPQVFKGLDPTGGISNYFLGNDPAKWRAHIPHYRRVEYRGVYPGIDLIWYDREGNLEFDFVVSPGADPNVIRLAWQGAESWRIDEQGDLVLSTAGGELRQRRPRVYQEEGGRRVEWAGSYLRKQNGEVRFALARYDATQPLIIDPGLVYSTYLGGRDTEAGNAIAVDTAGNAYVAGFTVSGLSFPTTLGSYDRIPNGWADVFVTKLNPSRTGVVYSTYLGGSGDDIAWGVTVDGAGNAYLTGETGSKNFPTTPGVRDRSLDTNDEWVGIDAFVSKLNATGSALVYSTYLGGRDFDYGRAIAVDSAGNAYITGETRSDNFPTTSGVRDRSLDVRPEDGLGLDAFVTKMNPTASALVYSTYLGGRDFDYGRAIAVDSAGDVYVTGSTISGNFPNTEGAFDRSHNGQWDAFVTRLNATASALVYSTYLGGSDDDFGRGLALDSAGNVYITGETFSTSFPTTPGSYDTSYNRGGDAFVTKLDPSGRSLVYSTYLGGSREDDAWGVVLDGDANVYIVGRTVSPDFPTTAAAYDRTQNGRADVFFSKLSPRGTSLLYSTYLGGSQDDFGNAIAMDCVGDAHLTGSTASLNFPTTRDALQRASGSADYDDAFIAKISPWEVASVSAASFLSCPGLAPGSIASAFGQELGPVTLAATTLPLPISLGDTTVRIRDGSGTEHQAPLFFVSTSQINYLIPEGATFGSATVTVTSRGQVVALGIVRIENIAPGLFAANADGAGVAAALVSKIMANGSQESEPVFRCGPNPGSCVSVPIDLGAETEQAILLLFGTGIRGRSELSAVRVSIGGVDAEVLYAGPQGGFVGLDQVNVRLPRSLIGRGELGVVLTVAGRPANTVKVNIK